MTHDAANIERIVAEVVRRLMLLADPPAPTVSPTDQVAASLPAASLPAASLPAVTESVAGSRSELVLESRVITLNSLLGRLAGVRQVLVPPGAVVTPAVKDELRKRGIRLEVGVAPAAPAAAGDCTIVRCLHVTEAVRSAIVFPLPAGAVQLEEIDVRRAVTLVSQAVRGPQQVAVVLTDEPLLTTCLLNRHWLVRAAQVRSVEEVKQAIAVIAANVLVVDPRGITVNQWQLMIQLLRKDLPRGCPPTLLAGSS